MFIKLTWKNSFWPFNLFFLFFKYIQKSAISINVTSIHIHMETDFFSYADKFVLIAEQPFRYQLEF